MLIKFNCLTLLRLADFEDFAQKETDCTWLCASVPLAPKVVESCLKVKKTQQVF